MQKMLTKFPGLATSGRKLRNDYKYHKLTAKCPLQGV